MDMKTPRIWDVRFSYLEMDEIKAMVDGKYQGTGNFREVTRNGSRKVSADSIEEAMSKVRAAYKVAFITSVTDNGTILQ